MNLIRIIVLSLFIFLENFPLNSITCFFDLISFTVIKSCKLTNDIMLSILCKELLLPTIFNAKFNFAYDLTLEYSIY